MKNNTFSMQLLTRENPFIPGLGTETKEKKSIPLYCSLEKKAALMGKPYSLFSSAGNPSPLFLGGARE